MILKFFPIAWNIFGLLFPNVLTQTLFSSFEKSQEVENVEPLGGVLSLGVFHFMFSAYPFFIIHDGCHGDCF